MHARVWQGHNELLGAAVLENASLIRHHTMLRAVIRHGVNDNYDRDHCKKQEGGCQNSTTCCVEYSGVGSTTDGAEPLVMVYGAGSAIVSETLDPW